jgi:SAM-dependent methyltransferase
MKPSCLICSELLTGDAVEVPEVMYRTGHQFLYTQCDSCLSLIRISDLPNEDELYPENYYSFSADPIMIFQKIIPRFIAKLIARSITSRLGLLCIFFKVLGPKKELRSLARVASSVKLAAPSGTSLRILDVGTGSGLVPYVLSLNKKIQSVGIDPYAKESREVGRTRILKLNLEEVTETWDLIMFHHSLEHIESPKETLIKARALLSPGGRILIRVPTVTSEAWRRFQFDWFQVDAPRHAFLPSRDGLELLMAKCGFTVVDRFDDSSAVQFWLSDYVTDGLSLLDPKRDYSSFRRTPSVWKAIIYSIKSRKLNKAQNGDQICVLAESVFE